MDNFPIFAVGTHGQGSYDSLRRSIAAVGANAHAEPLSVGGGVHESADSVNSRIRRARRARQAARFDNRCASFLNYRYEIVFEPSFVFNDIRDGFSANLSIVEVRILCRRVVAPNSHVCDIVDMHSGFLRKLRLCAIFVEARHCKPAVGGNAGCVRHGYPAICIAGIAYYENSYVIGGVLLNSFTLAYEYFAVDSEQVGAFHSLLAGHAAHEQSPICAVEAFVQIACGDYVVEQRECAVVQLHLHALQRLHSGLNFDEVQLHGLIRAEHVTAGDSEQKGVADLSGGSGYCNSDGFFHFYVSSWIKSYFQLNGNSNESKSVCSDFWAESALMAS